MTDNEIIKALKCCNGYDCETCRALKYCDYMHPGALARASLDLINRQKAEIESLKHRKTELQIRNQELQHEKSEAIKEFADSVKQELRFYYHNQENVRVRSIINHIDNLVKEMTEVEE